ncbi:hypothetical protein PVAND_013081 [Polypedilum vanderplanki]|uniref:Transducer of regulated CREB activity N-terminal domain-containing protein n=1 Tax=Polypedilum vanderplanki TaxID=319348 RepID=A0A9J6CNK1_POLVA|nr:hypothetical protein PVAND_013081 [Polypedilum vanderplanki]
MANPRKFSEKIALLNQKEAEGNAEFERIMREVSEVSAKGDESGTPTTTLAGLLTTGYINDSNKNGNADSKSTARESRGRSVGGGPMRSRRNIDTSPYSSNNNAYLSPPQESSWRRTSSDSAIHQSLTQAQDMHNNVHQSLMLSPRAHKRLSNSQSNSMKNLHHQQQPINQQHSLSQQNMQQTTLLAQQVMHQQSMPQQHLVMNNLQQDMKSRSVSRLPGIHVYPTSQNDELLQIPVGNSTGSLPDLTLVHFQQSPISNPLDPQEQQHLITTVTSSFTTNPSFSMASTNQSTTNQLQNMTQQQMYTQMGNNLDQFSPKHFNNDSNNEKGSSSQNMLLQQGGNNNANFAQQQQSNPIPIDTSQQQRQQQQSPLHHQSYPSHISVDKMMSYRSTNTASPANLSLSQGNLSKQNSYRNQNSPNHRPSPGSSPLGNIPGLTANFDSNSSAPCSPSPQMTSNNGQFDTYPSVDSFYLNPTIQQHFEQFSLVDSPLPDYITSTNDQNFSQMNDNYNGILNDSPNRTNQSPTNRSRPSSRANHNTTTNSNQQQSHTSQNNGGGSSPHSPHSPMGSDTMLAGNNYDNLRSILGSSSPLDGALLNGINNSNSGVNDIMLGAGIGSDSNCAKLIPTSMSTSSPSHHPLTQTTTAIPEIIFSDYSSGSDFTRDLLSVDNFLELGMNTTELQMFENANIIDPTIEENFRRDLY